MSKSYEQSWPYCFNNFWHNILSVFGRVFGHKNVTRVWFQLIFSAVYFVFNLPVAESADNLTFIVPRSTDRSTDRMRPVYVISVDVSTHFLTDFDYNWVGIIGAIFMWYIVKSKRSSPSILLKVFKTKFQITNSFNKFRVGFFQFFYCILLILNCFHEWLDTAMDDELYVRCNGASYHGCKCIHKC